MRVDESVWESMRAGGQTRLLARVLKEGVQFWYNDTSTVKSGRGGGGGCSKKVPLENLLSLRYT